MLGSDQILVYVFRDPHFAPASDTIVSAAPVAAVVRAYGGGGLYDSDGLSEVFRGAALFKDDKTGKCHLAVWGARKAARFREALRRSGFKLEIIKNPPPGRLAWYATRSKI
jgi:hypothetical protein